MSAGVADRAAVTACAGWAMRACGQAGPAASRDAATALVAATQSARAERSVRACASAGISPPPRPFRSCPPDMPIIPTPCALLYRLRPVYVRLCRQGEREHGRWARPAHLSALGETTCRDAGAHTGCTGTYCNVRGTAACAGRGRRWGSSKAAAGNAGPSAYRTGASAARRRALCRRCPRCAGGHARQACLREHNTGAECESRCCRRRPCLSRSAVLPRVL